ncbi:MAG: hypothetical protein ACPG3X_06350 [Opitutales bacterium]
MKTALIAPPAALLLLLITACDKAEPVTYTIPKEERVVSMPGPPAPEPSSGKSKMQVLPGMAEAAEAAADFSYTVPDDWEEYPPQSIRKANFRVSDALGSAEITVTVFPGDVGGKLANINRWRSQIGLDPIDRPALSDVSSPIMISKHNGLIVRLNGPEQSILGGMLGFHGSTWFFKMQGTAGTVAAQRANMEQFLKSVQIQDDHH